MPSKIKLCPEDKYWIIPLNMSSQILRDREGVDRSLLGAGERGERLLFCRCRVFILQNERRFREGR